MSVTAPVEVPSQDTNDRLPRLALGTAAGFVVAKIALHAFTSLRHYGYFRDELYYLDMARHLDWGYVDAAPLIALYAKLALLMGGSLATLRIIPALAGAGTIILAILIARELGGSRYAQFLAGLTILLCPARIATDSLMTMNAVEPLFWMGCALVIARILRAGNSRRWLWFGLLAGLGLQNKHSTLFFGFAVTIALLLTPHRREFLKPWMWIAGAIAVAIFLPNLVWQIRHHFPTLEDLENVRRQGKNVVLGPVAFTVQQIVSLHPALFPVWLAGLIYFLRDRRWRALGITFLVFFVTMELAHAKDYYLFPIYPMLFAGGSVLLEGWLRDRAAWTRAAVAAAIAILTIPAVPLATWMLSPENYLAYSQALGFKPRKAEVHHEGPLPQPMGDQFGWEELSREVAQIYDSLPPAERAQAGIFAVNYGEAGALHLFGPKYGLPSAFSDHQNHYFWGPPQQTYAALILLQWDQDDVERLCTSWEAPIVHYHPFGMGEENQPIYLCRGPRFDIRQRWERWKHWN
ncbi:MAG: glycosyltransferase family 39 protein [Acidobacteriia bacterium]|nr:glycosyltransferase family 39 protein [Terriglobia bacterium]